MSNHFLRKEERDEQEMRGLTVPCYLVSWAVQAQIRSSEINSFPSLTPASPPFPTELCSLRGRGMTNSKTSLAEFPGKTSELLGSKANIEQFRKSPLEGTAVLPRKHHPSTAVQLAKKYVLLF